MSSPVVSFVIATHDGHEVLGRCLDSIARQTLRNFEVLVFDNASAHGTTDAMRERDARFTSQRCERNLGFAAANNRAIAGTRGEFVALVNDDAWLEPHWAETMVRALEAQPKAGAAAGRTMQAAHPELVDAAGFDFYSCAAIYCWRNLPAARLTNATHQPFGPVASVAMYRRSALASVGTFQAEYFCYYEDTDLAVRLVLHDFETVYVPEALAYHAGSHTGRERSAFQIYHVRRNIEYLYWVNMLGSLAWRNLAFHLAFEALACGRAALEGQSRAVLRAKRDAVFNAPWILQQRRALTRTLAARRELDAAKQRLRARMRAGLPFIRARGAS